MVLVALILSVQGFFTERLVRAAVDADRLVERQGDLTPEHEAELRRQVAATQSDLDKVLLVAPRDIRAEVDRAIAAVNEDDPAAAEAAFAQAGAAFAERAAQRDSAASQDRIEQARLLSAEATLLHPFEASRAEPLLCEAAGLAETDVWYWIECGRARIDIGDLSTAATAFETAHALAAGSGDLRNVAASLNDLGLVRVAQGDLPAALAAYDESLGVARDLAARDPGNAGWARDVWVSYWRFAQIDPANAVAHWREVVTRMEAMAARGILLPTDAPYLEAARRNLATADAAASTKN